MTNFLVDYHLHSQFSHDSTNDAGTVAKRAVELGISEICFTDHVEFDECYDPEHLIHMPEYCQAVRSVADEFQGRLTVRLGAEIGLHLPATFEKSMSHIQGCGIDYIIGSIHYTDCGFAYIPSYFEEPKEIVYTRYLEQAVSRCCSADSYHVLGHFDYVTKNAPYTERSLHYSQNAEAFDAILSHLVKHGIGIELNTAVYRTREEAMWGLDVYKRYAEMGGQFATVGSDAHRLDRVGFRIGDAIEYLRASGIPYLATFRAGTPILHPLGR